MPFLGRFRLAIGIKLATLHQLTDIYRCTNSLTGLAKHNGGQQLSNDTVFVTFDQKERILFVNLRSFE
jgi:hypothetical protein